MKKKARITAGCIALAIFVLISMLLFEVVKESKAPGIQKGKIDISGWDFGEKGAVNLSGEWEFYWGKLLEKSDFENGSRHIDASYFSVPCTWNSCFTDGEKMQGGGFATYRASVKLPEGMEYVYFKISDMASAYRLYADGELISENGKVSDDEEFMEPEFDPCTVKHRLQGRDVEIIVQISNASHSKGGFWEPIFIGDEVSIRGMDYKNLMASFFIMGFIISMAAFHMIIASFIKKEKAFLFFSIFCMLISLRLFITGERYIVDIFKSISWENLQKTEYLSFYLMVPVFIKFIDCLYEGEFDMYFLKSAYTFSLVCSAGIIIFPARVYTRSVEVYQIFTIICGIYVSKALISAKESGKEGSGDILLGFVGFYIFVIAEMASLQNIFAFKGIVFWGVMFFLTMLAIALSKQFSKAVVETEELAIANHKMVEKIKLLNKKLKKRNTELADKITRDGLSGLYNHRYIHEKLREKEKKSILYKKPLTIGMFDIDRFKNVNDTYGHQFGDKVIVEVARILSENAREADIVGRYGGEEFMVIFDGASEQMGFEIAERLRAEIERQVAKSLGVRVTISGGVTGVTPGEDSGDAIKRADRLLYIAKNHGRNRIERSES